MSDHEQNKETPDVHDEHDDHGSDKKGDGKVEKKEKPDELSKALGILTEAVKKGDESGFGVETVAAAVLFLKETVLLAPWRASWNAAPAWVQRNAADAAHGELVKALLSHFPFIVPQAYFVPSHLLGVLAKCGVIEFKLTDEEKAEMLKLPTNKEQIAYKHKIQEEVIGNIVLPGEGIPGDISGTLGTLAAKVKPEVGPVVLAGKAGDALLKGRDSYLKQVREAIYAKELAKIEAAVVAETAGDTKEAAALSVQPAAHLHTDIVPGYDVTKYDNDEPAANNNKHFKNAA